MQIKIIFFVLFMLSFTVMHDTMMNIVQPNEKSSISNYVKANVTSQESNDIQEVHSMFHFVGYIIPYKNSFALLQKEKILSYALLQHTPPHKETSYKPPIV
ncbi:MAG: hypothetical protein ABFQ64_08145 [Campylobacterota bacterium]